MRWSVRREPERAQQLEQQAKAQRTHLARRVHADCDDGLGRDSLLKGSEDVHSNEVFRVGRTWRFRGCRRCQLRFLRDDARPFNPSASFRRSAPPSSKHEPVLSFS